MPRCSDSNDTDTQINFEGFVIDIHDKKYSNSTVVSLVCSAAKRNKQPPSGKWQQVYN